MGLHSCSSENYILGCFSLEFIERIVSRIQHSVKKGQVQNNHARYHRAYNMVIRI